MFSSRIRGLIAPAIAGAALLLALPGCEQDTKPRITRLTATPSCDEITYHTEVKIDPEDGSVVSIDTLTFDRNGQTYSKWLEVRFFGRASGGNELSDPTGANSPLKWTWEFGDGESVTDVVGPTHKYVEPPPDGSDSYTVTLTVEDDDGDKHTRTLDVFVGEAYDDLDILDISFDPDPTLQFKAVPGSVAVDLSYAWGEQLALDRMDMRFDGELRTICRVSGLFETYLWRWTIVQPATLDTTVILNLDPVEVPFAPQPLILEAQLNVIEQRTGIERFHPEPDPDSGEVFLLSANPVGLRVGRTVPRTTVPDQTDTILLEGYLLNGLQEMSFELEWADSAATLDDVDFNPLVLSNFNVTSNVVAPGRVMISLTNASGYTGTEVTTKIADLNFTPKKTTPGVYPIRVREPFAIRDGDLAEGAPFTTVDGHISLDTDCDGDGVPDSFQAEFSPEFYDCNGNLIHDTCDIQDGTSQDCNENGIPDECDISNGTSQDENENGIPDECE
jgi:PKD repeat protein